jgi:hypothetical protein
LGGGGGRQPPHVLNKMQIKQSKNVNKKYVLQNKILNKPASVGPPHPQIVQTLVALYLDPKLQVP